MISNKIHKPEEEEKEKHVPHIEVNGNTVTVKCGRDVQHPSTDQHYIGWIKLFGVDKQDNFRELGSANLTPVLSHPGASFMVNVGNYKKFLALIYCNLHGLWENKLKLE